MKCNLGWVGSITTTAITSVAASKRALQRRWPPAWNEAVRYTFHGGGDGPRFPTPSFFKRRIWPPTISHFLPSFSRPPSRLNFVVKGREGDEKRGRKGVKTICAQPLSPFSFYSALCTPPSPFRLSSSFFLHPLNKESSLA